MPVVATWNVNSIKVRLPLLQQWLASAQPDIVLLQELKCQTEAFPHLEIEALGYRAYVVGQKTYNGVAILSKTPLTITRESLPGDEADSQARYLEAKFGDLTVAALYLPNGNPIQDENGQPHEKFTYKLRWLERFHEHVNSLLATEQACVFGGDYNIIPQAEDVYDPKGWEQDALFHPQSRAAWRRLLSLGLTDAFRARHPNEHQAYTFWDYQAGAWPRDNGLRIDHFLLSPEAADRLQDCRIDREPRGWEKASDHTPVLLTLNDA